MGARLHSWWQYIRKHRRVAIIIALVSAAMVLIFVECLMNVTGFNGYYTSSTLRTISGSPPTITRTEMYQPGKTLWDWLQLLITPTVLALAGYAINLQEVAYSFASTSSFVTFGMPHVSTAPSGAL
jgi:hypothetical protein